MLVYMILVLLIKVIGDYLYEDSFDANWYRYFFFILGVIYVFGG